MERITQKKRLRHRRPGLNARLSAGWLLVYFCHRGNKKVEKIRRPKYEILSLINYVIKVNIKNVIENIFTVNNKILFNCFKQC